MIGARLIRAGAAVLQAGDTCPFFAKRCSDAAHGAIPGDGRPLFIDVGVD